MTEHADAAAEPIPPARPAATVVVVREASAGAEVLLLRRSDVGAFAGMWVFPGGRVETTDPGTDELSRARSAAVREANEEVGLTLDPASLVDWSHWTPPPIEIKRFSTWFFVAPMTPTGSGVRIDRHEIVDHLWLPPSAALEADLPMAPPTHVTLSQLAERHTVHSILGEGPRRGVERFSTHAVRTPGSLILLWHGDAGYESGDAELPGPRHRMTLSSAGRLYERS